MKFYKQNNCQKIKIHFWRQSMNVFEVKKWFWKKIEANRGWHLDDTFKYQKKKVLGIGYLLIQIPFHCFVKSGNC